ncbi:hypothetical protein COCSUDRAFT_62185 [Coccomyxa subellipsoidea C-169]|uniref:Uncharacterized protein n=1 Tax=Coccomyxa subellipsoidea (strain C-169) TaxID=574566 RepID=I0Z2A2_COCSC|nr:hypothetical protein COCSUDRAFT_62185 [Coccomyxa subellipsoidea C-169]EIE24771.1 hypothetical protein COCSUDRAFT_62185 [Coccomyxa subellipsoidea C-169]|eukprot:XP_005649315.1 hypothetical protein COCSUDRAFT_62185 [Coccomyxa subellipsoidea C-169]
MASNSTVSTSTTVQYSGPSYYGDGPTLPHLVGFTLAIVSLAIALDRGAFNVRLLCGKDMMWKEQGHRQGEWHQ